MAKKELSSRKELRKMIERRLEKVAPRQFIKTYNFLFKGISKIYETEEFFLSVLPTLPTIHVFKLGECGSVKFEHKYCIATDFFEGEFISSDRPQSIANLSSMASTIYFYLDGDAEKIHSFMNAIDNI